MHGSPKAAQEAAEHVLRNAGNEPGHIFNLGHGFSPGAQIDCVEAVCVQSQVNEMREKMVAMVHASRIPSARPSKPSITATTEKTSGPVKKVEVGEAASSQKEMCSRKQVST